MFVAVETNGETTIWLTRSEMGQGVMTALPMILAESMDADWKRIKVVQAPASRRYGDMGTVGSGSIRDMWQPLKTAGTSARHMLVEAAAETWGVPVDLAFAKCDTVPGFVVNRETGARLSYGTLAPLAAQRPVPTQEPSPVPTVPTTVPRKSVRQPRRTTVRAPRRKACAQTGHSVKSHRKSQVRHRHTPAQNGLCVA